MRTASTIFLVCALVGCSSEGARDETGVKIEPTVEARILAAHLPQQVKDCAAQLDQLKGPGFTLPNAEKLERTCQTALGEAPLGCSSFLSAAGRTGFKAAALIRSDFADNSMQPLILAREDADKTRPACGV